VVERLDLSPRTARRLVRLERAPEAVATAFREGRITLLAAEAILRGAPLDETVTLRKLQEQVSGDPLRPPQELPGQSARGLAVYRRVLGVNLFGPRHRTKAALASLVERRGLVVVVNSIAGVAPLYGRSGYAASKHALHGLFGSLGRELER
jgi:NAD(P)-dependent dehydrogenase (short-subunit alcohol dehydrogenase family)